MAKPRILLIDDEEGLCRMLEAVLGDEGYEVRAYNRPVPAVEDFVAGRYDLVITDIKMPIIDGLQLIKELSDIERHIEFILISGFSDFSFALTAIKYGVSDYLLKPIIPEELQSALIKIIGRFKQFDFHESPNRKLQLQSNCNRFIKKAYEYVENHYQNPISLHEVAEYLGISHS